MYNIGTTISAIIIIVSVSFTIGLIIKALQIIIKKIK
jgi:hypothetical protein